MGLVHEKIYGKASPTHSVIWLHGLGERPEDYFPVIEQLGLDNSFTYRFLFPQASLIPITVENGALLPGWYDVKGDNIADKEDLPRMSIARDRVEALLLDNIELGIPSKNIILAGFSQGGAVAYYSGIRTAYQLGGIAALSAYLPFLRQARAEHSQANLATPILAMHGTDDLGVPFEDGKFSAEGVAALGYCVDWRTYPSEHCILDRQITEIGHWINQIFTHS